MSTEHPPAAANVPQDEHSLHLRGFDREVQVPIVLWTGIGLTVVTVLSFVFCWWGLIFMERWDKGHEATVTAIQEESPQAKEPPLPALQISPQDELKALRTEEDRRLDHAAWADRSAGTVDLPIKIALDALVKRGVAPLEGAAPAAPPAGAGATSDATAPPSGPGGGGL